MLVPSTNCTEVLILGCLQLVIRHLRQNFDETSKFVSVLESLRSLLSQLGKVDCELAHSRYSNEASVKGCEKRP